MAETATKLGRVSLVPRGAYSASATYNRLDIVEYEGSSYLVLADGTAGVTPAVGESYMMVAKKGDKGDTGATGATGETGSPGASGSPGSDGEDGVGIQSIARTGGDGSPGTTDTYTITLTDGTTSTFTVYNGADGTSFTVLGRYDTLAELKAAHPTGSEGDAWAVGSAEDNDIYLWDVDTAAWINIGSLQGPPGHPGQDGANGVTFTPAVSEAGVLSFTNDGGLPNPDPVNIKGEPGTPGGNGDPGADGKTAYQYAQEGGYTGTEAEFQELMGSGPWLPLEDGVRMLSAVIPKGRMRGDVNGDGKITKTDSDMVLDFIVLSITLDAVAKWCADVDLSGSVDTSDSIKITNFISGKTTIEFADFYGNWSYVSEEGQDPYWTADISIPGLTAQSSATVVVSGEWEPGMFFSGEIIENGIRICSIEPPITDVPCTVFYGEGDGSVVVCGRLLPTPDNIGAARAPKIIGTFIKPTDWDENNQHKKAIDGVSKTENDQIIQVIPRFSSMEEYINCKVTFKCDTDEDGFLIFHAETIPTKNLGFRVLITDLI